MTVPYTSAFCLDSKSAKSTEFAKYLSCGVLYSQPNLNSFEKIQLVKLEECAVVQVNASWNYKNRLAIEKLEDKKYLNSKKLFSKNEDVYTYNTLLISTGSDNKKLSLDNNCLLYTSPSPRD